MTRELLVQVLHSYRIDFDEEKMFVLDFLALLTDKDCFQRHHLPGHLTGSAWVVNGDRTKTLLVHHAKLNKWVQPGGHADGDENIKRVALREANEETGLTKLEASDLIFDLDIHTIPARKDMPEHLHYDVRFLVEADEQEKTVVSEESHDVQWVPLHELECFTTERSVLRMRDKISLIYG